MKFVASVALRLSRSMTTTLAVPAVPGGVVAVIDVAEPTTIFVAAAPPMVTLAPETKPVPVIVTLVPPPIGPPLGEMLLSVNGRGVV